MKYSIRKNWKDTLDLIVKRPIVLAPFIIGAFIELLALELIYFSPRKPLSFVINPVIAKFFGEAAIHYPGNLALLPRIYYFVNILIYVFIGVFIIAVSINIFKNIVFNLPLKTKALIKNAMNRYPALFIYGALLVALLFLLRKIELFILSNFFVSASKFAPNFTAKYYPFAAPVFLFLANLIMQVFVTATIPILVLEKTALIKALARSIYMGIRYFLAIFALIFVPLLIYFPISLLKHFSFKFIDLTFPEITLCITIIGIIIGTFIDSFVVLCVSRFVLDKRKENVVK